MRFVLYNVAVFCRGRLEECLQGHPRNGAILACSLRNSNGCMKDFFGVLSTVICAVVCTEPDGIGAGNRASGRY